MYETDKPIAFLIRQIDGTTPYEIMRGAMAASEAFHKKILFVQGGIIGKDTESAIYSQLKPEMLSGLISWASVENDVDAAFYSRFNGIARVLLTVSTPGIQCISIDTYTGQKMAIQHLISTHGYKKIAFIRGPDNHAYAQARYKAYQDAMSDAGLRTDPRLVSPAGNWTAEWGGQAVTNMIDNDHLKAGTDFDTIACANDSIAIGVIEELRARSIQVPQDITVIGYNNSGEAVYHNPPLTTVLMPFYRQGYEAVKYISEHPGGMPGTIMLDSELVVRQSCGCHSHQVLAASLFSDEADFPLRKDIVCDEGTGKKKKESIGEYQGVEPEIIERIVGSTGIGKTGDPHLIKKMETFVVELVEAYWNHGNDVDNMSFLSIIDRISNLLLSNHLMIDPLHGVVSTLRGYFANRTNTLKPFVNRENISNQSRVVISESSVRQRELSILNAEKKNTVLQAIGLGLMTALETGALVSTLAKLLPKLKIDQMSLILQGRFYSVVGSIGSGLPGANTPDGHALASDDSFSADFFTTQLRNDLMIQPMNLRGQLFGYCIYGISGDNLDGLALSSLKNQISNNRFSSQVYEQNNAIRQHIEQTLVMMTAKVASVASRSAEIKENVQSGSTAMEELAAGIQGISKTVHQVNSIVDESNKATSVTKKSIDELVVQIKAIRDITMIITDIAERTNLLSLNASIEAAHAGSAGKGFSVVAKEVKSLAFSTVESAAKINTMIKNIQEGISVSAANVGSLSRIIPGIVNLSVSINQAIGEQEIATREISNVFLAASGQTREITADLDTILDLGNSMKITGV